MNLTNDIIASIIATAKAYDTANDPQSRRELGERLDALADNLSEGQLRQVVKMLYSI